MAEKSVLTNQNLLDIVLNFAGKEIKKSCDVCGKILKYQIFNQYIEYPHKKYINLEVCEKKYFCDEECLYYYKRKFSNKKFCAIFLFLTLLSTTIIVLIMAVFGSL